MEKLFSAKKLLPVALALAAFALAADCAYAQGTSSVPQTYNPADDSVNAQAQIVRPFASARSTRHNGKNSYAQAPVTIRH